MEITGQIDVYSKDEVTISHWDKNIDKQFPYLLNPCECGTFLPIEVCENPMVSSTIGLLSDLARIQKDVKIPKDFKKLFETMISMAEKSIDRNLTLEIR